MKISKLWIVTIFSCLSWIHEVTSSMFDNFFSSKNPFEVETTQLSPLTRVKRQGSVDPKAYLDQEIEYLIATLPEMIDVAIEKTEASQRFKVIKRMSQGYAILVASWGDIYSDWLTNNRSLADVGGVSTIYKYGFLGFYGVGFGFPLLLGLPDVDLLCTPQDYVKLVDQYDLKNGLNPLFARGLTSSEVSTIIAEFDLFLRVKIACILDFESEISEAKEVLFAVDELNAAINLRIGMQQEEEEANKETEESTTDTSRRRQSIDVRPIYQKKLSQKLGSSPKKSLNDKKLGFHNSKYFESGVSRYL